jgi:hypothetical protein
VGDHSSYNTATKPRNGIHVHSPLRRLCTSHHRSESGSHPAYQTGRIAVSQRYLFLKRRPAFHYSLPRLNSKEAGDALAWARTWISTFQRDPPPFFRRLSRTPPLVLRYDSNKKLLAIQFGTARLSSIQCPASELTSCLPEDRQ